MNKIPKDLFARIEWILLKITLLLLLLIGILKVLKVEFMSLW
jgi:hypothetical protein